MQSPLETLGRVIARYLSKPRDDQALITTCKPEVLKSALRKGDILLVEGSSRISTAIKYLTQSSWSHAALYIGEHEALKNEASEPRVLLEADINAGVHAIPISNYYYQHIRICRPVGLSDEQIDNVINYAVARIGDQYDHKNIFDLARYFIQRPPIPNRWRRRLLALGSGDPTRAICSSLIAQAYQSIHYPILPEVELIADENMPSDEMRKEIFHIRHHSLFAPRDFDVSPYFQVIKPTLECGFTPESIKLNKL